MTSVLKKELQDNLKEEGLTVSLSIISNELHHDYLHSYTPLKKETEMDV